jgi:hypothetical protein
MRATARTVEECRNAASWSSSDVVDDVAEAGCAAPDPFADPFVAPLAGALVAGVGAPAVLCCAAAPLGANIGAATASSRTSHKARRQKLNFDPEGLNGNPRQLLAERRGRPGRRDRQPKLEG